MQLMRRVLWAMLLLLAAAGAAGADVQMPQNPDGEMQVTGYYWRDRNTRVINPSVSLSRSVLNNDRGVIMGAHYLLDAITSASVAAGATADQPFNELRHEAGFDVEAALSRTVHLLATYSYSSESDYWSHNVGLRLKLNLARDNTGLLFGVDYGDNVVGKRLGPTGYLLEGRLDVVHLVALATQVLSARVLGTASYELTVAHGFMNNVYRPVMVGSEVAEFENLPTLRLRHVAALSLHGMVTTRSQVVPHITFRPAFRFYTDSWGVKTFIPEMAVYVPIGPVELRPMVSYYGQIAADFYRCYQNGPDCRTQPPSYAAPVPFNGEMVYTSDVKLSSYSTVTAELSLRWRLSVLRGARAIGEWMDRSIVALGVGMWSATNAVGWQYGIPLTPGDPKAPAGCSQTCSAFTGSLGFYMPL